MNLASHFTEVRYAERSDVPSILRVEWQAFKGQYEFRYTPLELLRTYERYPQAFRVVHRLDGTIVGYSCAVFLTKRGSQKLLSGEVDALQDMVEDDVVPGGVGPSTHLHLEVLAVSDPSDIATSALLIRDILKTNVAKAVGLVRFISGEGITPAGHRLLKKAGFQEHREPHLWPDGTISRLYVIDFSTPKGRDAGIRFGLLPPDHMHGAQSAMGDAWEQHSLLLDSARQCIEATDPIRAVNVLKERCDFAPLDPRPWALLGVANQVLGHHELAMQYYSRAIDLYEPLRKETPYAWLNTGLMYSLLGRAQGVLDVLPSPNEIPHIDADFWFKCGYLFSQVNRFGDALSCLSRARDLRPGDVPTLIRMGYCHEGLQQFDVAIECAEQARGALADMGTPDLQGYSGEVLHALGHFHSSRFVKHHDVQDREAAIRHMQAAAEDNPFLQLCLAVTYNEVERYGMAASLLNSAIQSPVLQTQPLVHHQAYLYRAEAYCGLGEIDDAIKDLGIYRAFCFDHNDSDGVALANLFMVRARLRQHGSIEDLQLEDLAYFTSLLRATSISPFAVPSLRQVHERYTHLLDGIIAIKSCHTDPTRMIEATESLERAIIGEMGRMTVFLLTDSRPDLWEGLLPKYVELSVCPPTDSIAELEEAAGMHRHWLAHFSQAVSDLHWQLMGNHQHSCSIYVVDERTDSSQHLHNVILAPSRQAAASLCTLQLLYEKATEYLDCPMPVFGLIPEAGVPSAVSQRSLLWDLDRLLPLSHELEQGLVF